MEAGFLVHLPPSPAWRPAGDSDTMGQGLGSDLKPPEERGPAASSSQLPKGSGPRAPTSPCLPGPSSVYTPWNTSPGACSTAFCPAEACPLAISRALGSCPGCEVRVSTSYGLQEQRSLIPPRQVPSGVAGARARCETRSRWAGMERPPPAQVSGRPEPQGV